ncbi:contractile injection system tape measure protein [Pandoraea pneumonica]|uniref:contractile injection system tape measure protein n=1 Tax=Pandoraea pneumonica TaxID=2508299 RepID=UPI003CEADB50
MDTRHRIDHLAFDLTFTAGGLDMSQSDALHALVVGRLLAVVSAVFDSRAPGEAVIRIDRLDIDLGSVKAADLPEALAESLSDALEQALTGRDVHVPGQAAPVVTRYESAADADTASLMGFLTSGRLPDRLATATETASASASASAAATDTERGSRGEARGDAVREQRQPVHQRTKQQTWPDAQSATQSGVSSAPLETLFARVLAGDVEPMRRLLLNSNSRNVQIARLVRQFPGAQIDVMLHALRPAEAQRWLADLLLLDDTLAVAGWKVSERETAQLAAREKVLLAGLTPLSAGGLQMPWHAVWQAVLASAQAGVAGTDTVHTDHNIATRAAHVLTQGKRAGFTAAPLMLAVLHRYAGTSALAQTPGTKRSASPGMLGETDSVARGANRSTSSDVPSADSTGHRLDVVFEQDESDGATEALRDAAYSDRALARTRTLLANAFASGQAQALYDIWPQLMREAPMLVGDALRHYAAYPDLRDRMAMSLPESLLEDMLSLLSAQVARESDSDGNATSIAQSEHAAPIGWKRRRAWSEAVTVALAGASVEVEEEETVDGYPPSSVVNEARRHVSDDATGVSVKRQLSSTGLVASNPSSGELHLHDGAMDSSPFIDPGVTATAFAATIQRDASSSQPHAVESGDTQATSEAPSEHGAGFDSAYPEAATGASGEPVGARSRLIDALLSGASAPLYDDWAEWISANGEMLTSALRQYGRHDDVLTRIVVGFPETMLADLATLLHPASAVHWQAFRALAGADVLADQRVLVRAELNADDIDAFGQTLNDITPSVLPPAPPQHEATVPTHASVDAWKRVIWKRVFEWLLQTSPVQPLTLDETRGMAPDERLSGWQLRLMQVWESSVFGNSVEQIDEKKPPTVAVGRSGSQRSAVAGDVAVDPTQRGGESLSTFVGRDDGQASDSQDVSIRQTTSVAGVTEAGREGRVGDGETHRERLASGTARRFDSSGAFHEQRGDHRLTEAVQDSDSSSAMEAGEPLIDSGGVNEADRTSVTPATVGGSAVQGRLDSDIAAEPSDIAVGTSGASASDALQRLLHAHRTMISGGTSLVGGAGRLSHEARAALQRDLGLSRAILTSGAGTLTQQAWAAVVDVVVAVSAEIPSAHRESFYEAIVAHTPDVSTEASHAVVRYYASVVTALLQGSMLDLEALSETALTDSALDEERASTGLDASQGHRDTTADGTVVERSTLHDGRPSSHASTPRGDKAAPTRAASKTSPNPDSHAVPQNASRDTQTHPSHQVTNQTSRPVTDHASRPTSVSASSVRQRLTQHHPQESGPDMASTQPTDFLDYLASADFRNGRGAHPPGLSVWLHQAMQTGALALRSVLTPAATDDDLAGRWLDLVPPDLWLGFARVSSRDTDEIDRMLRLSADVTELFALSLDTSTPAQLARVRWLTLFAWLFAPQRAYAGAALASALVARLSKATSSEIPPALASRIREQTGIDIAVRGADSTDLSNTPTRVVHAGAVLLWPFLSRLWEVLGLMEVHWDDGRRDSRFVNEAAAERAVLLLHYVVSGRTEVPEYDLVMHKLLCGVPSSVPVARHIEVAGQEETTIDGLLRSTIQHWSALGHTSPDGLREAFLQRPGTLSLGENGWHLKVEHRAFDVLLTRLPWGISTVQLSCMPQPIWVQWS